MMDDSLLQIGVGGIFALMVIDKVFSVIRGIKQNGSSGSKDPAYWQAEFRNAIKEIIDDKVTPRLDQHTRQLETLKDELRKHSEAWRNYRLRGTDDDR